MLISGNNIAGITISAALVLVKTDPVVGSIVASAAHVLDWDTAVGRAVVWVSVVKAKFSLGPESVEVAVENVKRVESILSELDIALEEFLFA